MLSQLRVKPGCQGQDSEQNQGRHLCPWCWALGWISSMLSICGGGGGSSSSCCCCGSPSGSRGTAAATGKMTDLRQRGSWMQEGQNGSKMLLEEVEERLPYLGSEDSRVQGQHVILLHQGVLGGDRGVDMFPVSLSFGIVPFTVTVIMTIGVVVVVIVVAAVVVAAVGIVDAGRGCDIPLDAGRGVTAGRRWSWIGALSAGGLASSTGGVYASINTLDLAPAAAGTGDAGAHRGRQLFAGGARSGGSRYLDHAREQLTVNNS